MGRADDCYDLVVVGGGMGGLAAAVLAQRQGLTTALLEAHTKLGGCAGYFERGPYTFDAGATALMGLNPGEPVGDLLASIGLDFEAQRTAGYRVYMPDGTLDITPDSRAFEDQVCAHFPGREANTRRFWRLQEWVGQRLFRAASNLPKLPVRSTSDVLQTLGTLGLAGSAATATSLLTVGNVLNLLGLSADRRHRAFVAMLLQDTAQAGPETVPFANAAVCLQAYRMGMSRPRGGMKALAEGIGSRFDAFGGDLRTATKVDRVEREENGEFVVVTRRRHQLRTRQVIFNLPIDLAAGLLGQSLEGRLGRTERQSRAVWSAFTGYLAIRREAVPEGTPLFHQVLQDYQEEIHDGNNALISLSPEEDEGYGPTGVRVATMSTHVRPSEWWGIDRTAYEARKAEYSQRMMQALGRALPEAPEALVHAEFASPRSFARYTRRTDGAVGGPPVSRRNSNLLAVGSDVLGPGLWLVGDSVFPGQGTMAVVLSAMKVVKSITGKPWQATPTGSPARENDGQARMGRMTSPATSVSRKSRP